jgi:hypothetical protein
MMVGVLVRKLVGGEMVILRNRRNDNFNLFHKERLRKLTDNDTAYQNYLNWPNILEIPSHPDKYRDEYHSCDNAPNTCTMGHRSFRPDHCATGRRVNDTDADTFETVLPLNSLLPVPSQSQMMSRTMNIFQLQLNKKKN